MREKFITAIGVFAAILNYEGGLLIRRRTLPEEEKSLISGKIIKGDWELPGGIVEEEEMLVAGNEKGLIKALKREVKEELGLEIDISLPLQMFPVVLVKDPFPGKVTNDIAMLIIIQPNWWKGIPKGKTMWVVPKVLEELTKKPAGEQLVSGWGKRMHRMSLIALSHSPDEDFRREAKETLEKIYSA